MVIQSYPRLTVVSLALSLELALSSILPAIAISPSTQQQHSQPSPQSVLAQRRSRSRLRFKIPNISPSRRLEGGIARGNCGFDAANKIQMKALLPDTNIGLTTTGKPTFFFQISPSSVEEGKFLLLNAKGDTIIYEKTFPLKKTGGVMSFTLPAEAEALQPGKEYTWELVANCDPEDQRGNPRVQGSIKRLPPSQKLASDIARIPMRDRAAVYAEAGYWYDSLKTLADLRSTNPNDSTLISDWNDLLESAGLSKIAKEPLL